MLLISACTLQNQQQTPTGDLKQLTSSSVEIVHGEEKAKIVATSVTTNYRPAGPVLKDPYLDNKQFVRVEVVITNTGSTEFDLFYSDIYLKTAETPKVIETFYINDSNSDDHLNSSVLQPGEQVTGALYFELPKDINMSDVELVYNGFSEGSRKEFTTKLG